MQAKLKLLEQAEPADISKVADSLIKISKAWQHATPEGQHELVKIVFQEIKSDFERWKIVAV